MRVLKLDYLVFTVRNVNVTSEFYAQVLGFDVRRFGEGRTALHFGSQKINPHEAGNELSPHAHKPIPGSADLCFVTNSTIDDIVGHLRRLQIAVEQCPVARTGVAGRMASVYIHDPDLTW